MTKDMPVLPHKAKVFFAPSGIFSALRAGFAAIALLYLGACAPVTAVRGNLVTDERLSQIKPGDSDKDKVVTVLGTPTATATFDHDSWYYIGQKTEQYSFFDPEVTEARIVAIRFDEQGKVTQISEIDPKQGMDIDPVSNTTPTAGQEIGFVEQMLGNLSHPGLPQMSSGGSGGGGAH